MNKSMNDFQGNWFGSAIIDMKVPARNVKTNKDQLEGKKPSEMMP